MSDPRFTKMFEEMEKKDAEIARLKDELEQRVAQVHWKCVEIDKLEKGLSQAIALLKEWQTTLNGNAPFRYVDARTEQFLKENGNV